MGVYPSEVEESHRSTLPALNGLPARSDRSVAERDDYTRSRVVREHPSLPTPGCRCTWHTELGVRLFGNRSPQHLEKRLERSSPFTDEFFVGNQQPRKRNRRPLTSGTQPSTNCTDLFGITRPSFDSLVDPTNDPEGALHHVQKGLLFHFPAVPLTSCPKCLFFKPCIGQ